MTDTKNDTPKGTSVARRNGTLNVPTDPIALGDVLARSGFFSDSRGAAQAAVKVMAGAELGFGPVASMTGIYIVKGRVTLSANLMAAAIKQHPSYTYRIKKHTASECVIDFIEDGEVIGTSEFSMKDAQAAGLAGSETYKKHPRNMLFARALSNGAKWHCPDVFGAGPVYTPEELGADIDGQTGQVVDVAHVEDLPDHESGEEADGLDAENRALLDELVNTHGLKVAKADALFDGHRTVAEKRELTEKLGKLVEERQKAVEQTT